MPAPIELQPISTMNRFKRIFHADPAYEPIQDYQQEADDVSESEERRNDTSTFSWIEYSIFLLLGVAMLWAWY
jgi:solute carrier family 29 (equilibrative nucleoside transporter), member 1/2/3